MFGTKELDSSNEVLELVKQDLEKITETLKESKQTSEKLIVIRLGGKGSGNHGHSGLENVHGGSSSSGGSSGSISKNIPKQHLKGINIDDVKTIKPNIAPEFKRDIYGKDNQILCFILVCFLPQC